MSNQTDEQKIAIVTEFANNVQPKVFANLAATDHNVNYFTAILQANWTAEFSIEWLTQAIKQFKHKFEWLAEPSGKPVLSKAQQRALVGLPEESPYGDNVYKRREKIQQAEDKEKREHESDPKNILAVKEQAEELARTASIGSHSDNASFRKLLGETFVHVESPSGRQIDWFATYSLRRDLYQRATNGSIS